MTKRTYHAPAGATSVTVNGTTYEVDNKGKLHCDDESAHADLLSHGYTFGDAPVATATAVTDGAVLQAQLDARAADLDAREAELDRRNIELAEAVNKATEQVEAAKRRTVELDQRTADLANRETDLAMRLYAVEQREAALTASAPPPPPAPPPAGTKPTKGK